MKKLIFRFLLLLFLSMIWGSGFGQEDNPKMVKEPIQHFTVDEQTGAITGLDCLQLKPRMVTNRQLTIDYERNNKNDKIWKDQTLKAVLKSKKIQQVGDRLKVYLSPNRQYFICVDIDHGGLVHCIHFFDKKNKLIHTYKFKDGQSFDCAFNTDGNCVVLTSSNDDQFIFLNSEGKEIYSGSYSRLSGKSNGSLRANVSSKGTYWIAFGQEGAYIGDRKGGVIHHINVEDDINLGTFSKNEKHLILLNRNQIFIFDLHLKKVVASSNHLTTYPVFDNMSIRISDKNSLKQIYYDFQ